ncbi:MAG TPA: NAD-dependent epimerase/dehydratase family protein, partial [Anaerolineaceae bacterium]|nr:NAD-dependent epimerase/dehydratase family protein [Anaerolineaceae bacterium]
MSRNVMVTGGAGFIGSNYVARLLKRGEHVTVYDNLSRAGAKMNLVWLRQTFGQDAFELVQGDVRDADLLARTARQADLIVHLAAQVAVTTSVVDPREDFSINAQGTFNLLEAARASGRNPVVIYASTNKVYGGMEDVRVVEDQNGYIYADYPNGIPETMPLDFHSPYGCSKGTGDQYVRDYHRIYGLPTVVMRQSCIYGPRQFGVEDQGWVAWFLIAAVTGKPISIYGDGKQVRDILFVEDLLNAYDAAIDHIDGCAGQIF